MSELEQEHPTGYVIRLSFRMLVAIVDISNKSRALGSPANHRGTLKALEVRGLVIYNPENPYGSKRLTALGRAYVEASKIEQRRTLRVWREELEAA